MSVIRNIAAMDAHIHLDFMHKLRLIIGPAWMILPSVCGTRMVSWLFSSIIRPPPFSPPQVYDISAFKVDCGEGGGVMDDMEREHSRSNEINTLNCNTHFYLQHKNTDVPFTWVWGNCRCFKTCKFERTKISFLDHNFNNQFSGELVDSFTNNLLGSLLTNVETTISLAHRVGGCGSPMCVSPRPPDSGAGVQLRPRVYRTRIGHGCL